MTVYSDSQYVVKAVAKGWAKRWQARGWMRTKTQPALNPDLWELILALCEGHDIKFRWVRGHSGNAENNRCDKLSKNAAK